MAGSERHPCACRITAQHLHIAQKSRFVLADYQHRYRCGAKRSCIALGDAHHFRDLVSQASTSALRTAIDLYRGDFLAGFTLPDTPEFERWQYFEAESLRRAQIGALEQSVHEHSRRKGYNTAIEYARRWLSLDPLNETVHCELMKLYAWNGQPGAALQQYEQCCTVLEAELSVLPGDETMHCLGQIRSGHLQSQVAWPTAVQERHNLPVPATPLVGREVQLARVTALLKDPNCRLLTILGPGGIGKTRLAISAVEEQVARFLDGVCYVDLAPVETVDLLAVAVLGALNAPDYGAADPERRLCDYLRGREMLLVLDNFEHLTKGADLLPRMLQSAAGIKLLVTP